MKQIAELLPIVLFFLAYQMDGQTHTVLGYSYTFDGIFSATAILMAATVLCTLIVAVAARELEKRQIWLVVAICAFGGLTLILRNELFIQLKPTIFNWALALVFLISQYWGKKNLLERALGGQIPAPSEAWRKICNLWIVYFLVVGLLNLVVVYQFSEAAWVSYKLYSSIAFTLVISALTIALLIPYIKDTAEEEAN